MSLTIRSAQSDDAQAVLALWHACGLVIAACDPAADFAFAKAGACSDVLIGEEATGRIMGSVMVGHDGHRCWLYYVTSDPGARGAGVGRRMIGAAEDWLRVRGIGKAQLLVRDTNIKVVSFYERLGFEVTPRIVMAKTLSATPAD